MADFGVPASAVGVGPADLAAPETVIRIGLPPRRVDVLTDGTGLTFDAAWVSRVMLRVDTFEVPFIGREHLVRNERTTGRYKDLGDLESMEEDPGDGAAGASVLRRPAASESGSTNASPRACVRGT